MRRQELKRRDHTFIGITQSLCPQCLRLLPTKIVSRKGRVYFQKHCPQHGKRDDFVCSDVRWFDRLEHSVPGKVPVIQGVEPNRGCPYDCGLCTEHEQHTCIGLLEITSSCNLKCPMCFASSGPSGQHLTVEQCKVAIDRLVQAERQAEVLQLSGGEPTIHPHFREILDYACDQPIDVVMINTNGIRFAHDAQLVDEISKYRGRVEVYFQFDGFHDAINRQLRGESLLESKLRAMEALGDAGINVTLVCTLQAGVNGDQIGEIVRYGLSKPFVTGISFQPATYTGRYFLPDELEQRITFPDVIRGLAEQAPEIFAESDFLPLPCAHPNGHSLSYVYRSGSDVLPLSRFIDIPANIDLLANGITFTRERARSLITEFLSRETQLLGASKDDCEQGCSASFEFDRTGNRESQLAQQFFARAAELKLDQSDVMRITITSFMDAYNFDVRQLMKSCVHHILPSGHIIPFSAYNVLYRDGHVPLPPLNDVPERSVHTVPITY